MAYLNTQMSEQELGFIVDNRSTQLEEPVQVTTIEPVEENSNFYVASQLKEQKCKLISALSQFPVTALWLIHQYEQSVNTVGIDDEALETESQTDLSEISKYFNTLSRRQVVDSAYIADKENLITALELFPYTFQDLTRLVDVIVYAHKFRGLSVQSSAHLGTKNTEMVLNRLEGVNRRNRHVKDRDWTELLGLYDEQFLFLSSADMHKYFLDVVFAEHGWLKLRQQIATSNARLVLFIANQYKGSFLDFDDLVQEGHTGLLKAVDRFDYRLGFQFSTYAGYWIRQAISRALSRSERVVRVPCGQVANINKVYRSKDEYILKEGREPSLAELAEFTQLSYQEINYLLSISQTSMALEGYEDDEDSAFAPIDFLEQQVFTPCFKKIAQTDLQGLLSKAINVLNPREAKVISCHFGVESDNAMTLQEIGVELNLTRERVRQIQVIALDKIRRNFGDQLIAFL
jgi:RNA polymerase primary sigma factor